MRQREKFRSGGGTVKSWPEELDFRPTQPVLARFGAFLDPDGNQHYLVQEKKFFV